jgi:hypothetical protein
VRLQLRRSIQTVWPSWSCRTTLVFALMTPHLDVFNGLIPPGG